LGGTKESILSTLSEVRGPTFYATLILVIAVLPILFMKGLLAGFFQPMIWSYLIAIVASMVVALILTPALAAFMGDKLRPNESRVALSGPMQRSLNANRLLIPAAALVVCGIIATAL